MTQKLFQVDAFTDKVFHGNPAAVVPLDQWLSDEIMQSIGLENNLAETAFVVPRNDGDYDLRWFTPTHEVELCGHATLATAHVVFTELEPARTTVTFHTQSGPLMVKRAGDKLTMDFPRLVVEPCPTPPVFIVNALPVQPREWFRTRNNGNFFAVYDDERYVYAAKPNLPVGDAYGLYGLCLTAPAKDNDIASRYFAPALGIPEDPVTGAIHCALVPYWAQRLGKTSIHAYQASARGGHLWCELLAERVLLSGYATTFMKGEIAPFS